MDLPDSAKEDVLRFQQIQQQLQMVMLQKQNAQTQDLELDNAIRELGKLKGEDAYEIVGNIMIKKPKGEIEKSLREKQDLIKLRISTLQKQQDKLSKDASGLQEKLSKQLK